MPKITSPEAFARACAGFTSVSHETLAAITIYADLLVKWQSRINLVSNTTLPDLWERHFLDSAQMVAHLPTGSRLVDLGSGAGFPGLVLAAFGYPVTLIESDQKKVAFMMEVARQSGIKTARFENQRIEKATPIEADFVTARALADVGQLLEYAEPYMKTGAQALFLKGDRVNEELTLASTKWHIDFQVSPSLTDPKAAVLLIRKASRV